MSRDHTYQQHFLSSPRLVAELVGHSNIRKNDTVLDLGAGSGVISSVLVKRAKQVIAVEIEPQALKKLRANLGNLSNLKIIEADISHYTPPAGAYKIFANIPFDLSAATISRYTSIAASPKSIYLIVQQQFARKLVPSDRHFTSLLGSQIAPWWQGRIRRPLRRIDFTPPPNVNTVLLELKPREVSLLDGSLRADYQQFISRCYREQSYFGGLDRVRVSINPERKPSELSPEQWVRLYHAVASQ